MNPWIIIGAVVALIIYAIDFALRRKSWKMNTREEKTSLIVNMGCAIFYMFASALGLLWGVTGSGAETAFGNALYDITLEMTGYIWIPSFIVILASILLRKFGKVKASIQINVIFSVFVLVLYIASILTDLL